MAARTCARSSRARVPDFGDVPAPVATVVHVSARGHRGGWTPGANCTWYVYDFARGAATRPTTGMVPVVPSGCHQRGEVTSASGGMAPLATMCTSRSELSRPQTLIWSLPEVVT